MFDKLETEKYSQLLIFIMLLVIVVQVVLLYNGLYISPDTIRQAIDNDKTFVHIE